MCRVLVDLPAARPRSTRVGRLPSPAAVGGQLGGEMMADAERHVGLALQRVGHLGHRRVVVIHFLERALRVDDERVDDAGRRARTSARPVGGADASAASRGSRTCRSRCCGPSGTRSACRRPRGSTRPRSRSSALGLRFCGMMLLMPVSSPSSSSIHGCRVVVLDVEVLDELPDHGSRRWQGSPRELRLDVDRRDVVGVVGVLDHAVEAEQHGQPRCDRGEARRGQRRRAERAQVDPRCRPLSGARRSRSSAAANASR